MNRRLGFGVSHGDSITTGHPIWGAQGTGPCGLHEPSPWLSFHGAYGRFHAVTLQYASAERMASEILQEGRRPRHPSDLPVKRRSGPPPARGRGSGRRGGGRGPGHGREAHGPGRAGSAAAAATMRSASRRPVRKAPEEGGGAQGGGRRV